MVIIKLSDAKTNLGLVRAAWQPQLFFLVVWFGIGLSMLIKGILSHREDLISGSPVYIALGIGFTLWFRAFRLELDEENFKYQAPLSRMKSISVDNLKKVTARRIALPARTKSNSCQSIIVESKNTPPVSFTINARVFPERKLIDLLKELEKRNICVIYS